MGREASKIYSRHRTPDKNTDYSTTKKIHRNREIFILILILQKVTQHIFIELMDKVTIHAEEKME
jgi:hypothetical protein